MTSDESLDEGVKAQWCTNFKEFHELAKPIFKKKHEDIDKYYCNLVAWEETRKSDGQPRRRKLKQQQRRKRQYGGERWQIWQNMLKIMRWH